TVGRLQAPFSSLVTAEDARAYKPDPRPFELALTRLAIPPGEILHAAFGWRYDLGPARAAGMHSAFATRSGAPRRGRDAPASARPTRACRARRCRATCPRRAATCR